jgi:hypothetical protein
MSLGADSLFDEREREPLRERFAVSLEGCRSQVSVPALISPKLARRTD